jgi:hypothetical protein
VTFVFGTDASVVEDNEGVVATGVAELTGLAPFDREEELAAAGVFFVGDGVLGCRGHGRLRNALIAHFQSSARRRGKGQGARACGYKAVDSEDDCARSHAGPTVRVLRAAHASWRQA